MGESKIVLGVTLGKRDIKLDNKTFSQISKNDVDENLKNKDIFKNNKDNLVLSNRKAGKYIFNNFDKFKDRIDCPIFKPILRYALDNETTTLDNIFLICTDQENEKFKLDDTLYFAEIIKKLIIEENKKKNKNEKFLKQEPIIIKLDGNVAELGDMNVAWKKLFKYDRYLNNEFLDRDNTKFYIAPIGGIDAINTAFLINCILNFKNNCMQLYLSKDSKHVYPLQFVDDLLLDVEKEKLKQALQSYNYNIAYDVLNSREEEDYKKVIQLIKMCKYRLYFNIDESMKICHGMMKLSNRDMEFRKLLIAFSSQLNDLKNKQECKIRELYINARIKFVQEQYVDFLLRMFRIQESINRYFVEDKLGIPTSKHKKNGFKHFTNAILENKELERYLEESKNNGNKLEWRKNPNNPVLKVILKYIIDCNKDNYGNAWIQDRKLLDKINKAYNVNVILDRLSQLRNNSIGAHGYEGISLEVIENTLKEKSSISVDELFKQIEDLIEINFKENKFNCYEKINEYIFKIISD